MIDGLEPWPGGKADVLAVVLHGWRGSRWKMRFVTAATKEALGPHGGVDVYVPQLAFRWWWSVSRASTMVIKLLDAIDDIIHDRGEYRRIILIGHSMGGVLARRLFLVAAQTPPGFRREEAFAKAATRSWAGKIDRHVTLGAFNRGWQASERDGWWISFVFNCMGLSGHLMPRAYRSSVFDLRIGSPFMVQTRLHWLAYRRWQHALRSDTAPGNRAGEQDPVIVQIIGNADDLTSPLNQVDLAIDRPDYSAPPKELRNFYLEMKNSTHKQTIRFDGGPVGLDRSKLFVQALTAPPDQLLNLRIASDPGQLVEDLPSIDPRVTDGIFIMHGIRDDGYWTYRLAKRVRERATGGVIARTPTYGYFAMLPFLMPWIRTQKVEWFMDQYVGARAQFPTAELSFIGHSNGTYLAARALLDYDDATFKNVFFAGSVVKRSFPWKKFVESGRLKKFHNVRAAKDWVVALLPKSVEWVPFFDLGGAGFDGFRAAGTHPSITQARKFANGQHSAALVETQWDHIADFILTGQVPPETPADDFVSKRPRCLRALAWTHCCLPVAAGVLLLGFPVLLVWLLLPTSAAHGVGCALLQTLATQAPACGKLDLTMLRTIVITLVLVVYFAALKFFITRV